MKSPAFQFYPSDYLSSPDVMLMSLPEEAAYLRLLMYAWQQDKVGYLPNNESSLRRFARMTPEQWAESRDIILKKFPVAEDPTLRYNGRLLIEVEKQAKYRERSSEGGKKSAEKRWGKKEPVITPLPEKVSTLTPEVSTLTKMGNQNVTLPLQITVTNTEEQSVSSTGDAGASDRPPSERKLAIEACKSIAELTALWDSMPERQGETGFKQLFTNRRKALEAAKAKAAREKPRGCDALIDPNKDETESFEVFWKLYLPFQGEGKFEAKKIWITLPSELRKRTLAGLPNWIANQVGAQPDIKFHRHAPTFLNGSPWENENYGKSIAPLAVSHRNVGGVAPTQTFVPSYQQKIREQAAKTYR
ncbi:MAG: hypothetical protein NVS3B25_07230 [Hymenobacter sp.]